MEVEMNDEKGI